MQAGNSVIMTDGHIRLQSKAAASQHTQAGMFCQHSTECGCLDARLPSLD